MLNRGAAFVWFSVSLEVLDRALVLLGFLARREGSEIFSLLRLGVDMTGVDAEFSAFQFANHLYIPLLDVMQ